jgi:thiol:disulfide interchange protein DsbD
MDYGYEGTAVFPFDVTASSQVSLGVVGLKAHVHWLVCWEICIPGKAYLGLNLNAVSQVSAETDNLIDAAVHAEPVNAPASVKIDATATRNIVTLSVVTGKQKASAEYYPLDDDSIRNAADQTIAPLLDCVKLTTERAGISDTLPKELKGVLKLSGGHTRLMCLSGLQ